MKKILLLLSLLVFAGIGAFAQPDVKVTTGVVEFQQGEFCKAASTLSLALESVSEMKDKNRPKAYYYYAKSMLACMTQAAKEGNTEKLTEYKDAPIQAFENYKKARETDVEGKWTKMVDDEMRVLSSVLLASSIELLNQSYKAKKEEDKRQLLTEALRYTNAGCDASPANYLPFDLRGQVYLGLKDSVKANADLQTAVKNFNAKKPERPDQMVAYTYYRLALTQMDKDLEGALKSLADGKTVLKGEYDRIQAKKADYQPKDLARFEEQYADAKKDLDYLEMQLFLNAPDKRDAALKRFEQVTNENPNDYNALVGYASLLEQVDKDKAITVYERAIAADPKREFAYFNLGALYNNMGKEFYDKSNNEKDASVAEKYKKQADEYFAKAIPQFEKSLELNPKSIPTVTALKQLTILLSRMEDYTKYKDMEAKLKAGGN